MIIRKGGKKDVGACVEIARVSGVGYYDGEIQDGNFFLDSDFFFVADDGGDVVGFALGFRLNKLTAYMDMMAVREDHRDSGVGTELFSVFKGEMKKAGVRDFFLVAPKANKHTVDFYRGVGLKQGKEYVLFFDGPD